MPGDGTLTGRQWLGSAAMATAAAFFALYFSAGRASVRPDVFTRRGRIPGAAGAGIRLTILSTNDLHSRADGCCGTDSEPRFKRGGYARLSQAIAATRAERVASAAAVGAASIVLTLDAGDWYAGTIFSSLGPNSSNPYSPELEYFATANYTAVTLGNHDFDAGLHGLSQMLSKARPGVPVLSANLRQPVAGIERALIRDFYVGEAFPGAAASAPEPGQGPPGPGMLRVGLFGLLSPDAAFASRGNRAGAATYIGYDDVAEARNPEAMYALARAEVARLRGPDHQCDIVVCLFHGGTVTGGMAEDAELARAVPGIDAIVAGHTHERYLRVAGHKTPGSPAPTVMWQCGALGESLGIVDFDYTDAGGLKLVDRRAASAESTSFVASATMPGENGGHCMVLSEQYSGSGDADLAARTAGWRAMANTVLGTDTGKLVYNGTLGPIFTAGMDQPALSGVLGGALLDQVNRELEARVVAAADAAETVPHSPLQEVSGMLGNGRDPATGAALKVSAFIMCVECTEFNGVHVVGDRAPMLASDVIRMTGITGSRPIALFYMEKKSLKAAVDLVDLLFRYVSPLFGVAIGGDVKYRLGWGLPFINRVQNFTVDGVGYDELPDLLLVGTQGYIAPIFWKVAELSHGMLKSLPCDSNGAAIPETALESTFATGLPVETELLVQYLARQR